jgi:DNA-binding FrmR family transcriptional regulator
MGAVCARTIDDDSPCAEILGQVLAVEGAV